MSGQPQRPKGLGKQCNFLLLAIIFVVSMWLLPISARAEVITHTFNFTLNPADIQPFEQSGTPGEIFSPQPQTIAVEPFTLSVGDTLVTEVHFDQRLQITDTGNGFRESILTGSYFFSDGPSGVGTVIEYSANSVLEFIDPRGSFSTPAPLSVSGGGAGLGLGTFGLRSGEDITSGSFSIRGFRVTTQITSYLFERIGPGGGLHRDFHGVSIRAGGLSIVSACVQPPSGLVSWWPGDGNAGDLQSVNDGTLQGGATFATGMVGQAFSLDGVDAFVEAPENGSLDFNGPFTIDLWVKPNTDSGPGKRPLVSKYDFGSSNYLDTAYELSLFPTGRLQFGITCGTNPIMFRQTVPNALPLNVFSHVAAVYSQDPVPALEIYVNGVAQDGTTLGGVLCTFINQNNIPFRIGKRIDAGFGPVLFDGLIDEVEVFNRALSASEIQAIYSAGRAGKCKAPTIVSIDIKPDNGRNTVNPNSGGVIPVAILTTDTFDATTVDPTTVAFGPAGATIGQRSIGLEDVDGDGDLDLVLHFPTQETGIACADTEASLSGETFDGTGITGSDAIVTVGCEVEDSSF